MRVHVLVAVAMVLFATGGQAFSMYDSDQEPSSSPPHGGSGGGSDASGYESPEVQLLPEPDDSMETRSPPIDKGWVTGTWKSDAQGLDPTLGYSTATRDGGPSAVADPTDPRAASAAERLIEFQRGWTTLDFSVKTVLGGNGAQGETVKVSQFSLKPGAGWFVGIVREPDESTARFDHTWWSPMPEEHLRIRVTPHEVINGQWVEKPVDSTGCADTRRGDLDGWVNLTNPNTEGMHLSLDQDLNDETHEYDLDGAPKYFRAEEWVVTASAPAHLACKYVTKFSAKLMFSFEAPAPSPVTFLDPTGNPQYFYADEENFTTNSQVLGLGPHQQPANLVVLQGNDDGTEQKVYEPNIPLQMLYMPVLPIYWVCDGAGLPDLGFCVDEVLNSNPQNSMGWGVTDFGAEANGLTLITTESFGSLGMAAVHFVAADDTVDLADSRLYTDDGTSLSYRSFR